MNQENLTTGPTTPVPPMELDQWSQLKPNLTREDLTDLLLSRMRRTRGLSYVLAQGATGACGSQLEGEEILEFAWVLWHLSDEILSVFRQLNRMT
ncbi:hypothetical protein [Endothiovibrio diazotrophicus]